MDLAATMDAVASEVVLAGVVQRAYGYPVDSITPPCAVVGYPEAMDFDATFDRGSDHLVLPVFVMVGKVHLRASRDALSALLTGATGFKDALDGTLGGVVSTCRVQDAEVTEVSVGGVAYLAAKFTLDILT